MDPWMQDNTEITLGLRKRSREAFMRFKAAPFRTTGKVFVRAVKLSFVVSVGAALALLRMASSTTRSDEEEYGRGIHPYDPNGNGEYANLGSLADKAETK